MSYADHLFIKMCQDILDHGVSTKGEKVRPHWELGPAPGLVEMGMMVFGSGRSILDLSSGRGVGPKTSSSKKVAHAQKTKETTRKPTKTGRRTKNSKH